MFSQNQSFFFLVEDSRRKIVELGWKSFVDSLKNWADGWENLMVFEKVGLMIRRIIGMMKVACMV